MTEPNKNVKDDVQVAFETLEHMFVSYNNYAMNESNKHHLGHPERVEHDLSESQKEHLSLLRAHLTMEISEKINATLLESSKSSDRLGAKVFWLNIVMAVLTSVLALSSIFELYQ
jgi:hypothetical protein